MRSPEKEMSSIIIELNPKERDLLVTEIEGFIIPEIRGEVASGMRKELREEREEDEVVLKDILEKLKKAA
jgi:hypothetical protein